MSSFKLAAIRVLRESDKPLHYEEITKFALENSYVETSGVTPEATMNAQIAVDIKRRKEKSPFVRVKPGVFGLNPRYTQEEQRNDEAEEKAVEELSESIGTQYVGKAGEHLVVSELLFKGYNASIMSVDMGIDIVATKDERLFNIQVKTSNENKFNYYVFDVRISSFEKYNRNNTYYIFVLKGGRTNFLILPYVEIQKNIDQKNIKTVNKNSRYRVNVSIRDGLLYLGNRENNLSYYMNNWDLVR